MNVIDDDLKVKDLWCNETWDFSTRVVTRIPQLIKHCIMAVSIHSLHVVDDCVVWADNISGVYTTKLANLWLLHRNGHAHHKSKMELALEIKCPREDHHAYLSDIS